MFSAPAAQAAGEPGLVVPTATEHIDAAAISFVVPIAFEDGSPDDQISSVNFTLDYDQACVRIDNPSVDITGVQPTFLSSFNNDVDAGTLQASIVDRLRL